MVKNLPANSGEAENAGSIPGLGRSPGKANGQSIAVCLPGKSHGQRSLTGYSPQGRKESDMTEQLSMHACLPCLAQTAAERSVQDHCMWTQSTLGTVQQADCIPALSPCAANNLLNCPWQTCSEAKVQRERGMWHESGKLSVSGPFGWSSSSPVYHTPHQALLPS